MVGFAAAAHDRQRFGTLTLAPEDWQACRQKMRTLKMDLGLLKATHEWAWVRERGSKTGMLHVHFVQWGDFIRQDVLQNLWGARADIRVVKSDPAAVAGYVSKGAGAVAGYLTKEATADYLAWLHLNGGRPVHTSRGFFGPGGYEGARQRLRAAQRAAGAPEWVACKGDPPRRAALRDLEEASWHAEAPRTLIALADLGL